MRHSEETKQKLREINLGKKHSEETRIKMSRSHAGFKHKPETIENMKGENNHFFGKKHSEETKQKMREAKKRNPSRGNSQGGYHSNQVPTYNTYALQLEFYGEECRRNIDDPNILEVKCTYCGKWFRPTLNNITRRLHIGVKGDDTHKLYCSDGCRLVCPLFGKSAKQLIKRDKIAAGIIMPHELNREAQPDLRKMVLLRDNYICQKCGSNGPLHCHHIDPVISNPIESADVDNCITLCIECHGEVHKLSGCGYGELRNC